MLQGNFTIRSGLINECQVGSHAVFFSILSILFFIFIVHLRMLEELQIPCYALFLDWSCGRHLLLWLCTQTMNKTWEELLPVLPCINQSFGNTAICFPALPKSPKLDYPIEAQTQPDVTRSVPQGSMHLPLQVQQLPTFRVLYFAWWLKAPAAAWTLRSSAERILTCSSHSDHKFEGRWGSVKLHCHAQPP